MTLAPEALARLREAIGDDDEVLADILQSFVDEAGPLAEALLTAARDGDLAVIGRAAHTLKSSARDLGDAPLADVCADLEREARTGRVEQAEERAARVAAASLALRDEVAAQVQALRLSGSA